MGNDKEKPKLKMAVYWGAACGGCCVSVLDVHEALFDVVAAADLVFWPIALDTKYADVEKMPDGFIDVCLFNGAVRNSENEYMARLLRLKSKILVAYGSCAHMGGIPGLANFTTKEELFKRVYEESESTVNPDKCGLNQKWKLQKVHWKYHIFLTMYYLSMKWFVWIITCPGAHLKQKDWLKYLWRLFQDLNFHPKNLL